MTIVERVSKKSVFKKIPFKTPELVIHATISGLEEFTDLTFTITGDNGSKFARHNIISNALKADFSKITDDDLYKIMDKLNNRSRKILDYAMPNEIFFTGNNAVALIG